MAILSPMSLSHPRLLLTLCCVVTLGIPQISEATEWVANPSVRLGLEYNDNITLTTAPHDSVTGANLTTNLDLGARQESWEVWAGLQLSGRRYVDRDDLDADNRSANLRYEHRAERSLWSLKTSYTDESILNTTTIDADVGKQSARTNTNLNPGWSLSLTETTQLRMDYQYIGTRYDDGVRAGLLDYQQQAVNLTLSHQHTSRISGYAILGFSTFEVTTPESQIVTSYTNTSQTNTVQLGISYDFTETLKGSLSGGPRKTVSETKTIQFCGLGCLTHVPNSSTSYGSVFEVNLKNQLELTTTSIGFRRGLDPSGSGSEVQSDSLSLGINRQLTPERLSLWASASIYKFEALDMTSNSLNRKYYQFESGWRWRWREDASIDASYRYSRQQYLNASEIASANAVFVTFSYMLPKNSISR